jgi:hypothetical protein
MTSGTSILTIVNALLGASLALAQTFPVAGPLPYRESPACEGTPGFLGYSEAGVDTIIGFASISERDVVYDVGVNAAEVLVAAASKVGARGVGFPLCPKAHAQALQRAQTLGVTSRVKLMTSDFVEADYSGATVVVLTVIPQYLQRLMPKLSAELKPGARIVSPFPMGEACPDRTIRSDAIPWKTLRVWTVPLKGKC